MQQNASLLPNSSPWFGSIHSLLLFEDSWQMIKVNVQRLIVSVKNQKKRQGFHQCERPGNTILKSMKGSCIYGIFS